MIGKSATDKKKHPQNSAHLQFGSEFELINDLFAERFVHYNVDDDHRCNADGLACKSSSGCCCCMQLLCNQAE